MPRPIGIAGLVLLCIGAAGWQEPRDAVVEAFRARGIELDLERGLCLLPVEVLIRDDLLEYVLVDWHGAAHESLFVTEVVPSELNTALLALGVEPGQNARWIVKDPPPTDEERRAGASPYVVVPPQGDGFYLYAAWRTGDEVFLYRVEDLLRNLATGRSMERHRWVYLGSRMIADRSRPGEQVFAADLERNHVNLAFFSQGNTLITGALPECQNQTIWLPNAWLLPPRGAKVAFVLARQRITALPPELEARLPVVAPEKATDGDGADEGPGRGGGR